MRMTSLSRRSSKFKGHRKPKTRGGSVLGGTLVKQLIFFSRQKKNWSRRMSTTTLTRRSQSKGVRLADKAVTVADREAKIAYLMPRERRLRAAFSSRPAVSSRRLGAQAFRDCLGSPRKVLHESSAI